MRVVLKYVKNTKNFACYETASTDFRFPYAVVVKMWVPLEQLETNGVQGEAPPEITVMIQADGTATVTDRHPETGIPWN